MKSILSASLLWQVLCALPAVEAATPPPLRVPAAVASLLDQVRNEADAQRAEALLLAYQGPAHALVSLAMGNACLQQASLQQASLQQASLQQAEGAPAAVRGSLLTRAEAAFTTAAQLDPTLLVAQLGIARCASARGDWRAAVAACAIAVPVASASASDLSLYVDCAIRAGDARLATTLVTQGITRFPAETVFRRQELTLLVNAERWDEARVALQSQLAASPTDGDLWRSLAGAESRAGDALGARIALEAALLLRPDDRALRQALAELQLAANQAPAAYATIRSLVVEELAKAATAATKTANNADPRRLEFAARVAMEADHGDDARQWLQAIPDDKRSRSGHLLAARLAAQANDLAAADNALQMVLRQGESDPAVVAWAGSIAESRNDLSRAESLYRQANAHGASIASLRLVVLLHRLGRTDEARNLLVTYRQAQPNDAQALMIERLFSRGSRP